MQLAIERDRQTETETDRQRQTDGDRGRERGKDRQADRLTLDSLDSVGKDHFENDLKSKSLCFVTKSKSKSL